MSSEKESTTKSLREELGYVDFDVFGYRVYITFTNDLQASRDQYDSTLGHFSVANAGAFHNGTTGNVSYLFFKWDANPEQIAHESFHAINRMMKFIGAEYENEVMAYHIGHLVAGIHSFLKYLKKEKLHIHADRRARRSKANDGRARRIRTANPSNPSQKGERQLNY